jgi:hypothetical protein
MAEINTLAELTEALGPVTFGRPDAARHNVFKWTTLEVLQIVRGPGMFTFWQCLQQYRLAPNAKKAILIFDGFLEHRPEYESRVPPFFFPVSMLDNKERVARAFTEKTRELIDNMKVVGTFFGKLLNRKLASDTRYTSPDAELFAALETDMANKLVFAFRLRGYDPGRPYFHRPPYNNLSELRRLLTEATFDPDAMGLWGGA